jgi:predicted ATP-binding protein involved in virulence
VKDFFLTKISIGDLEIPLSETERKHFIITGKNGSGKTTALREINQKFQSLLGSNSYRQIFQLQQNIKNHEDIINNLQSQIKTSQNEQQILNLKSQIANRERNISNWQKQIDNFSYFDFNFIEVYQEIENGSFILTFFQAQRMNKPQTPSSIENVNLPKKSQTAPNLHVQFIKFLVRLRNTMLNEQFDGDKREAEKIKKWFDNFERTLKNLFGEESLKLKYFNKVLNFKINYENREFGLNELSDGYSSLLAVVTELILRMEAHNVKSYDMQGVVLIDEVETHLHVELQKKVLPFLIDFFPKIQFIVTTHSPFVLSSLSNAVILDLEKKFITSDLSSYSYDALIESYFDSDKYSQEVKDKLFQFEELSKKESFTDSEKEEFREFEKFFKDLPKFMADELAVKVNEILLSSLGK